MVRLWQHEVEKEFDVSIDRIVSTEQSMVKARTPRTALLFDFAQAHWRSSANPPPAGNHISRPERGWRTPMVVTLYELATALGVNHMELVLRYPH